MSNQERLDRTVQQLIQQALQHSFESQERTNAISSLISLAEQLPYSLIQDKVDKNLRPFYYQALTLMEKGMSKNIDRFPELYELDIVNEDISIIRKCFVLWYNKILKRKLIDLKRVIINTPPASLPKSLVETQSDTNILPPMEQLLFEENQRLVQRVLDYLKQDPDQMLHNCCSQKYPHCNCWEICQMRFQQPPTKWEEIAKALNLVKGTVSSHWYKKCHPLLKTIGEKFEFKTE